MMMDLTSLLLPQNVRLIKLICVDNMQPAMLVKNLLPNVACQRTRFVGAPKMGGYGGSKFYRPDGAIDAPPSYSNERRVGVYV